MLPSQPKHWYICDILESNGYTMDKKHKSKLTRSYKQRDGVSAPHYQIASGLVMISLGLFPSDSYTNRGESDGSMHLQ